MIALGLTVAARFSSEELVGGILNLLTWPMMLLSGIWFSLEGSPRWVQWIAHIFPLTHVLDAARAVMLDGAGIGQIVPRPAVPGRHRARLPRLRRLVLPLAHRYRSPILRFLSDNTATASPEILDAIREANHGRVPAYGEDRWTQRLDSCLSEYFATPVRAFPVTTGTAANVLEPCHHLPALRGDLRPRGIPHRRG